MGISFENALGIHPQAVKLRSQRAGVLANNLANADTPNYKARDLDFKALIKGQMATQQPALSMATTHEKHRAAPPLEGMGAELMYRTPLQPSIDGNTVEEQVEHAEYTKNSLAFQASFSFLDSAFKGLKTAIRGEP